MDLVVCALADTSPVARQRRVGDPWATEQTFPNRPALLWTRDDRPCTTDGVRGAKADVLYEPGEPIRHVFFPTSSFVSLITPTRGHERMEVGLVSVGIYVFNAESLYGYLRTDAKNPDSTHDFGRDVIPRLLREGARAYAHRFSDSCVNMVDGHPYGRDVGTVDAYLEANLDLTRAQPELNFCVLPDGFSAGLDRAEGEVRFHVTPRGTVLITPEMLGQEFHDSG